MHLKKLTAFILIVGLSTIYAQKYLCIAEKSTGFYFNKTSQQWEQAKFNPSAKYVITQPDKDTFEFKYYKHIVNRAGSKQTEFRCEEDFNEWGYTFCTGVSSIFKFNTNSLRFIVAIHSGYLDVFTGSNSNEKSDTPVLEIGSCSKL